MFVLGVGHDHDRGTAAHGDVLDGAVLLHHTGHRHKLPQALNFGGENGQLVVQRVILNTAGHLTGTEPVDEVVGDIRAVGGEDFAQLFKRLQRFIRAEVSAFTLVVVQRNTFLLHLEVQAGKAGRERDAHVVALQRRDQVDQLVKGFRNLQAQLRKDVFAVEEHREGHGFRQAVGFTFEGVGHQRAVQEPFGHGVEAGRILGIFELGQIQNRITNSVVDGVAGAVHQRYIRAHTRQHGGQQGAGADQLDIHADLVFRREILVAQLTDDLGLVTTGRRPHLDGFLKVEVVGRAGDRAVIGHERGEEVLHMIPQLFVPSAGGFGKIGLVRHHINGVEGQRLLLCGQQPGTQRTNVGFEIGEGGRDGGGLLRHAAHLEGQFVQQRQIVTGLAGDFGDGRGDIVDFVRLRLHQLQRIRQQLIERVVTIGVGAGTGDHHDVTIRLVEVGQHLIHTAEQLAQHAQRHGQRQIVVTLGQIEQVFLPIFVGGGEDLPTGGVGELDALRFRKRDRSVDRQAAGNEHTRQHILAETERQLVVAILGRVDRPGNVLTGFLPFGGADDIQLQRAGFLRIGGSRGGITHRVNGRVRLGGDFFRLVPHRVTGGIAGSVLRHIVLVRHQRAGGFQPHRRDRHAVGRQCKGKRLLAFLQRDAHGIGLVVGRVGQFQRLPTQFLRGRRLDVVAAGILFHLALDPCLVQGQK